MNQCCSKKKYSEKWDAYYCPSCNVWLEAACKDPECRFDCKNRPPYPDMKKFRLIYEKKEGK